MEELPVVASADLVNGLACISMLSLGQQRQRSPYRRVEIDEDGARDIFAAAGLGEEGLERAALGVGLGFRVGAAVRLEAMLQEVASAATSAKYGQFARNWASYSSQALLPSWIPAWPM